MPVTAQQKRIAHDNTLKILHSAKSNEHDDVSSMLRIQDHSFGVWAGILTFLVSAGYATIRYNLIKGDAWQDWPVFTLNKAFGVSSLLLLVIAVVRYRLMPLRSNARILYVSGIFGGVHILVSCMLLGPSYFEKFFYNGRLTVSAGFSMLFGALSAVLFISKAGEKKREPQTDTIIRSLAVVCSLIGLHVAFQGFEVWMSPGDWPGFLAPMTLVSFLAAIVAIAMIRIGGKAK